MVAICRAGRHPSSWENYSVRSPHPARGPRLHGDDRFIYRKQTDSASLSIIARPPHRVSSYAQA
ncbi:hypothetical protein KL86PLE_100160 [uncultured Pleomorphomonas sp.]|uniref:Uncharacterized protein n=1 Tax=uncultured Pleomorphomonas sp. TaxID=442121 RepID=A0A212L1K6_9HYPH|nr:hypothetical protein KL86PLE_100160 [uncultured Pleomorphomonas sp.]